MFNAFAYSAVDSIQSGKKQVIDTFVTHDGIKKTLNDFVDAQTSYTKAAIDSGIQTATSLGIIMSSQKFFDEITETFKKFVPSYENTTKSKK